MNNYVKISTAYNSTTGMILACEVGRKVTKKDNKHYIVITNRHLITDILEKTNFNNILEQTNFKEKNSIDKYFQIEIHDNKGNYVSTIENGEKDNAEITIEDIYFDESFVINNVNNDIMAFLISSESEIITVDNKIEFTIKDEMPIHLMAFPQVLAADFYDNKVQLKGNIKARTKQSLELAKYALEEYHYYENLRDLDILAGLSGATVNISNNNSEYIIGMNVSLPYQKQGENPFRLVYFLRIKHILNFLREMGVLLYKMEDSNKLKIVWINKLENNKKVNDNDKKDKDDNNKTILVLGASGAGKSSFIKSFALHKNWIDSAGDGQTTRSKVKYHFSKYQHFKVEIKLLNKENFVFQRMNQIEFDLIHFICHKILAYPEKNIYKDKLAYLFDLKGDLTLNEIKNSEQIKDEYWKLLKEKKDEDEVEKKLNDGEFDELRKVLLKKHGMFDIDELKYLEEDSKNLKDDIDSDKENEEFKKIIKSILSKESYYVKNDSSPSKLYKFFEKIYDKYIEKIKEYVKKIGLEVKNNKIIIEQYNEDAKQLLAESLKVVNDNNGKKSISSFIKSIDIYDSFSNQYALLFFDIGLNAIEFIDTKGLDHLGQEEDKENNLKNTFDEEKEEYEDDYGDTKITDGIDAVVYLKKLDSGKPTELAEIIPLIYKTSPQVSLYIIFTGVDIFYSDLEENIIDWEKKNVLLPKSVEYLKSNDFKELLAVNFKARKDRKRIIREVIVKNAIAFCGDEQNQEKFTLSNIANIEKLFKSIIMREDKSIQYVNDIDDKKKDDLKEKINALVKELFKRATKSEFGMTNSKITTYNYLSGSKVDNYHYDQYDFGYWNYWGNSNNRNRIDLCFNDAYNSLFSDDNSEVVNDVIEYFNENERSKIESILIDMKNDFLGTSKSLYKILNIKEVNKYKVSEESKESKESKGSYGFYELLRELYKGDCNPFDVEQAYFFRKAFKLKLDKIKESQNTQNKGVDINIKEEELLDFLKKEYNKDKEVYGKFDLDIGKNISTDLIKNKLDSIGETIGKDIFINYINKNEIRNISYDYVDYCFDFFSRYKNADAKLKDDFSELFLEVFKKIIKNDRENSIKNMLKVDAELRQSLEMAINKIDEKFLISTNKNSKDNKEISNEEKSNSESNKSNNDFDETKKDILEYILKKRFVK